MPYIKRVTKAGRTIEIEKYYTAKYNKKGYRRGERIKPSSEQQKKINTKEAERKIRLLMNANFRGGDLHVVLTYARKKGDPYRTAEEMQKDIEKFLRKLRGEYRKQGKELKYIHVPEIGTRGARHHHLVVNKIDTDILRKCWTHARVQIFPLDDSGQYRELAAYFIKYSSKNKNLSGKRWNSSKNLIRPEPKITVISEHNFYKSEAREKKGYYIDKGTVQSGEYGNPEYGGFGYFRYTLVKLE